MGAPADRWVLGLITVSALLLMLAAVVMCPPRMDVPMKPLPEPAPAIQPEPAPEPAMAPSIPPEPAPAPLAEAGAGEAELPPPAEPIVPEEVPPGREVTRPDDAL